MSAKQITSRRAPKEVTLGGAARSATSPLGGRRETSPLGGKKVPLAGKPATTESILLRYEADTAPLTAKQKEAIHKLQPSERMTVKQSLF